ncbi:hypothetical protein KP509_38G040100 [Ceratopteris richardii]|uniref:Protein kinase domain-containing protein n=1 Tax=Ceratopteris richardii TaxID=49495 RepID=A0A8T2Q464_CERRI|nr:hypothetical protein KP509_38G040100 [Ceratopteris richardii]
MGALDLPSQAVCIETRHAKRLCLRHDDIELPSCIDSTRLQLQLSQPVQSPAVWHEDDNDGHFNHRPGENLTPRYKILRQMGEGTFGRVLECWDRDAQELVAIKVVRSAEKFREAARIEVNILRTLAENDIRGTGGCVQIKDWFDYRNHICIVCEKLGPSLFDLLQTNNYHPMSIDLVQEFGRQILNSVAFMHSLRLIHTDLKPENVLLAATEYQNTLNYEAPISNKIKLIDFGSAAYAGGDCFSVVSTRHYRAPEVILGQFMIYQGVFHSSNHCTHAEALDTHSKYELFLSIMWIFFLLSIFSGFGWSFPCDIWSVGCILVELCSGEALFQTHENIEHLAMMERVLGPIPVHVIKRSMV